MGGTVVGAGRSGRFDVAVAGDRIADVAFDVGTTGADHSQFGWRSDGGTVGAGAERSVVDAPAAGDAGEPGGAGGAATTVLDATGLLVAPGLVDLQCNGAVGVDLATAPERLWEVAAALPRWGVTAWLPTVVTSAPAVRARARAALADGAPVGGPPVAVPLGLHLEGPFLAPARAGAHDVALLEPPSVALVEGEAWTAEGGVALVTLAPELPGAPEVVRHLVDRGVVVAAGHSAATLSAAVAGFDAGIRHVTHLFNAMPPLHHRAPGLVGAALTDPRVTAGVIADGVHVDPVAVRLAGTALGDRLCLVSDAVAALGAPGVGSPARGGPGASVRLGGRRVEVDAASGAVRRPDGTLAGASLGLDGAVRNLSAWTDRPVAEAVRAATAVPAGVIGAAGRGVVAPGARADLVLLTPGGDVVATVVGGRVAHDVRARP